MLQAQSKVLLLSVLAVLTASQPLGAAVVADLYVAQVPATALSGPPLDEAFDLALDQVLVKVTGQRGVARDPGLRRAVGAPGLLVRRYQPMPGRQVRVTFDPAALGRRLDAANLPVWADERPLTLVILPPEPSAEPPGTTAPPAVAPARSRRELLEETAASRGIPIVFAADSGAGRPTAGADPFLDPASAARAAGADFLLSGAPSPAGGPAMLRWTLAVGSDRFEWQGDAIEGAHGLADRLAARYASAAASGRVLRIRVTGVDSFDAYGRLQSYLRGVGVVQSVDLREFGGDQLVYELAVRGDINQLNDALALRRVLVPVGDGAGGEFTYRLVDGGLPAGTDGP